MHRAAAWFILAVLALLFITACGGNSSTTGTKVTVRVETIAGQPTLPLSVAYQIEDGDWAWLRPGEDASYSFYLPAGSKRYGVTVRCPRLHYEMGPRTSATALYQLTITDTTEPHFVCPAEDEEVASGTLSFNASSVTGAKSTMYFYQQSARWLRKVATRYPQRFYFYPQERGDFLIAAYSSERVYPKPNTLLAARLLRDVDFEDGLSLNITLSDADGVTWANVQPLTQSQFWTGRYTVGISSAGGIVSENNLGQGDKRGGTYARIANADAGDFYIFSARTQHDLDHDKYFILYYHRFIEAVAAGDLAANFPVTFPEDYEPTESNGRLNFNLSYPESVAGYFFTFRLSRGSARLHVWASSAWLDGQNSYTCPDLSAVNGFASFDPNRVSKWLVCTISDDIGYGEMLSQPLSAERIVPVAGFGRALEIGISCVGLQEY